MIANNLLLRLENISYHIGNTKLLSDISLTIKQNEIISLIGPNGAGKSTLVKIILGLIRPSSGKFDSQANVMSYVPQKFSVPNILPLQVKDLLAQSNSKRLDKQQKLFVFETFNIHTLLPKQIHYLSGGEMQRVLLAKALLDKPDLLILDEPMQGLDPESEAWLYQFIDTMPDFLRCAMLVVSHDLHWVMKGSRRVICLNKHICCEGEPSDIALTPEFVNLFGHFAPYIHHHHHCHHHT